MKNVLKSVLLIFAKLPLSLLYLFADFFYFLQTNFIHYRKDVVFNNLKNSFPELDNPDLIKIQKKFFKNLCDYPFESLKSYSISPSELEKHCTFENLELITTFEQQNKNVMLLCGHLFNWEWLIALSKHLSEHKYAVYHPVSNPVFDDLMKNSRERFGTQAISMSETVKTMMKIPNDGKHTFLFVADQSPARSNIHYELEFLNQETPVFQGFDKLAIKKNMAVCYIDISKVARGKYHYKLVEIKPDNGQFQPYEILHKFFQMLEENIKRDPANWLWSHRRWKYKKGKDY